MTSREILHTDRLILRDMTEADLEPLLAALSDPIAMRHYPAPYDRPGVEAWIQRSLARYRESGLGLWTVVLKASGAAIGDCGLTWQEVQGHSELEIGYHLQRAHHNRGYATEAARACLAWAFAHTDVERVVSFMGVDNGPSRRVAEKVHAAYLGPIGLRAGIPHVMYGTTRDEFQSGQASAAF